ncbi:hypothetical protein FACS1894206_00250 [Deltaproteobacteria bacterium]|nr:hypothetical protein FACS1894206_00250 [Deltaproteobacteria bacterium]
MRILSIGGKSMNRGFRELGHELLSVGYHDDDNIKLHKPVNALKLFNRIRAEGYAPDFALCCDESSHPFLPGMEEIPCPTALYSVDSFRRRWHDTIAYAFDAVFVARKECGQGFSSGEIPVHWLPAYARQAPCGPLVPWELRETPERDIPVSFVGTVSQPHNPERKGFLQNFKRAHPLIIHSGPCEAIYRRSRIVLNQTVAADVNCRCFEAVINGAALLTEKSARGIEEIFTPGEHILPLYTRGNWREAAFIAGEALKKPEQLAEIAENGHKHVLACHMARNRAASVLKVMEELIRENADIKRLSRLDFRRAFLADAYAMLGEDTAEPAGETFAAIYREQAARTRMAIAV